MKASFQLTLMVGPSKTVLANMPLARNASVDRATGLRVWEFQATPVMSTYLNAWVIGVLFPWQKLSSHTVGPYKGCAKAAPSRLRQECNSL